MLVKYGTTAIEYTIERKRSLKNTYINVDRLGVIVKTNELTSTNEIESYVMQKAIWIVENLKGYKAQSDIEIVTGARLYYLGKSYYIDVLECDVKEVCVEFIHSKFKIQVPFYCNQVIIHKAIDAFYKERAINKITTLVQKRSTLMEVQPEHISFRKSEKRWGSCSPTNRISFNYHLMKLSSSLIEYVVIHELCHINHKNHSKEFWKMVKRFMPEYKAREEKIKGFEKLL
ncbi:MAG: SprT family zinc-dependent metalloprotease [Candidatus Endonucleobacter bathymodioli]|uniref:SprT family zinc-dependent metalloprotease n=1 Tax=Candidatus Endonucleibacter bathymodioli TaxID=539814 RepID=A0AA90NJD7_9GAMM|nr:SprT family zinc-dependent metalloprotease [Candidatus Endonucleobacter bathymodioli]